MNLRQKRDIRRLTRQIIQIIFFLWMPALYTSAFSGVRYVIEQIRAGKPIEQNAFLVMLIALCGFTILFGRFFCGYACAFGTLGDGMYALSQWVQKKVKKKLPWVSEEIGRNRTETSENEIYSVISLNADLCIRIYKKVPWNQSLGSIFHVVHR